MLTTLLDQFNPDWGWTVAPLAMASEKAFQLAAIDPSIPEILYGLAALIYAMAAILKSTRPETSKSKFVSIFNRRRCTTKPALDDIDETT